MRVLFQFWSTNPIGIRDCYYKYLSQWKYIFTNVKNNNLTNKGEDPEGVIALFEALRDNIILISLNLSNNFLTPTCGQAIISCLRKNKILIHLETLQNQRFEEWNKENPRHPRKEDHNKDMMSKFVSEGLSISQVKEIKERIGDNRILYDNMRKEEWHERKKMGLKAAFCWKCIDQGA